MAPLNNDICASDQDEHEEKPDDIVISGMSGKFPESENIIKFKENLYNNVDMVTQENKRWDVVHPEIPQRTGKIRELNKFDAMFFAIHYKQADAVDPMSRILLELAYEAIVDAGVNPSSLRGTNTGCFIGSWYSESDKVWFFERIQMHGSGITGCSRAMLSNRISYWLGIHGPSYSIDTACSSSLYALDHALKAIRTGQCDAALVGGSNITLHPAISMNFSRLNRLAPDGKTKAFDQDADGYSRSDTIAVIFLQKAKDARRIYATVVHTKTNNDGYKEEGIVHECGRMKEILIDECYAESGVSPKSVSFIEANGNGSQVGDAEELNVIDRIFCKDRKEPLLIGSVKSNMGHSESASAMSAIVKVALAMETGVLPSNLHINKPRSDIPALVEGRIKVVTENTPWKGRLAAISSFGFGGGNAHALLRSNPRSKPAQDPAIKDRLPRLVVTSGRTQHAVETILNELEKNAVDSEYVALFHNIHADPIPGHIYRGYIMLHANQKEERAKIRSIEHFPGAKRPLWFVFAGMGSQWAGMGKDLLRLPVFAKAIDRCDAVLRPKGLDIKHIITNDDPKTFDNILNSFVGIAAIQVGLVDVLTEAGIVPDGIVGHSVGELGCAYADGCFTAEQMVLAAYSRGLASIETPLIHGSMAAVGLSHDVAAPMCPHDVEVACHNGTDSCTISGPAESVAKFVSELKERKIFAREVACSNIAYHSRYIAKAGPKLLHYLKQVIPEPKRRSEKWISSSVPKSSWGETATQFSSPEYHTNNLLCPVLFDEAIRHIPHNAITIEIAPHALLQAILRGSLHKDCINIPLTKRGANNGLDIFFEALGKLYLTGIQPQLLKIYPHVNFPVSRGTPMISPLVRWQHDDDWFVVYFGNDGKLKSGEKKINLNLKSDRYDYNIGYVLDGRNVFPASELLVLVWKSLATMKSVVYTDCPVVFENIKFFRPAYIPNNDMMDIMIKITQGTGTFEIEEGGSALATGRIYCPEDINSELIMLPPPNVESNSPQLSNKDVYKELKLRGYNYSGVFKAIKELDSTGVVGKLKWENNYVAFVDAMLQMQILQIDTRSLHVPTALLRLVIHPQFHQEQLKLNDNIDLLAYVHQHHTMVHSGGIEIRGLQASVIARRKPTAVPVLEAHQLVPYRPSIPISLPSALRVCTHLVLENISTNKLKVVEWVSAFQQDIQTLISIKLKEVLNSTPNCCADITLTGSSNTLVESLDENDMMIGLTLTDTKLAADMAAHLVMCGDGDSMLSLPNILANALAAVTPGGFLLLQLRRGNERGAEQTLEGLGVAVVTVLPCSEEAVLVLARKVEDASQINYIVKFVNYYESKEIQEVHDLLKEENIPRRLYLVSQNALPSGLMNYFVKESNGHLIRFVTILNKNAPKFHIEDPMYAKQLRADLIQNVLLTDERGWSSYRHTLLDIETVEVPHAYVNVATKGDLSSVHWLQGPITDINDTFGNKLCHVYYSSLNSRDVMMATGSLPVQAITSNRLLQDYVLGVEFSGRDLNGNRVMGLVNSKACSNLVLTDSFLLWDVPSTWTLEEASTVPLVYSEVYYALIMKGRMRCEGSILIHDGTEGMGQAAINIAFHMKSTIFVTVGSVEKKDFIIKNFPQIPYDNIGNSRDTSFEKMIMEKTGGEGVDIVLNSLSGNDKLQASLRCVREHGKLVHIGKTDMLHNSQIGMRYFIKYISILGIVLDSILNSKSHEKKELRELIKMGIRLGVVKPIIRQVFESEQISEAFIYLASGKCIGKTIIKIREEERSIGKTSIIMQPALKHLKANPRYYCNPDKTYLITGELDGFELELADWLILQGARKLVLTYNSEKCNGYLAWRLRTWKQYGTNIEITQADITTKQGCITLLESITKTLAPIAAIFNCNKLLIDVTHNLDVAARLVCKDIEHFVVFSPSLYAVKEIKETISSMIICEKRKAEGLPALVVFLDHLTDIVDEKIKCGQNVSSFLASLNTLFTLPTHNNSPCIVSSIALDKKPAKHIIMHCIKTILGVYDLKSQSMNKTLLELGARDVTILDNMKQALEREYGVFLSTLEIRNITLTKLCKLALTKQPVQYKTVETSVTNQKILEELSWQDLCSPL